MKRINKKKTILKYSTFAFVILAHVMLAVLAVLLWKYIDLSRTTFFSAFAVVVCLLVIIDIVLFSAIEIKAVGLFITSLVLSVFLLLVSGVGVFYVGQVNSKLNDIVDSDEEAQYETIRVAYTVYKNDSIKGIEDLNGKKVGSLLADEGVSAASVGRAYLESNGRRRDRLPTCHCGRRQRLR